MQVAEVSKCTLCCVFPAGCVSQAAVPREYSCFWNVQLGSGIANANVGNVMPMTYGVIAGWVTKNAQLMTIPKNLGCVGVSCADQGHMPERTLVLLLATSLEMLNGGGTFHARPWFGRSPNHLYPKRAIRERILGQIVCFWQHICMRSQ